MPLPPAIDQAIRKRFADVIAEGEKVADLINAAWRNAGRGGGGGASNTAQYEALKTKALNLVEHVGASAAIIEGVRDRPKGIGNDAERIVGILQGLADDYANGFLDSIFRRAEAEVTADYLGQAEGLLKEGQPGKYDHVPAAVLLGAVLEQALRTICGRQSPPIPVIDAKGDKRTLNPLIDELKKTGVFNELKAKQLRAWVDIRNAAAHGEFSKFARADVEGMQHGVGAFLGDYL